jgi:hemoglobin-like flavoprotein
VENPLLGAKSAFLGRELLGGSFPPKRRLFPLSCRFLIRGEPPNKNAASKAPFQERGAHRATGRVTRPVGWVDLRSNSNNLSILLSPSPVITLNIELLEQSLDVVKQQSADFTATFYANLFADYPALEPLFANAQMTEQGKKLFAALVLTIDNLRNPDLLTTTLKGLGTRHIKYGVLPQHYPMVGNSLLKSLESCLGNGWTIEVKQAWIEAYTAVTQLMLDGAEAIE